MTEHQRHFLFGLDSCMFYAMLCRILDAVGGYAWAIALEKNLRDPDKEHRVEGVFLRYCGGNYRRLKGMIDDRRENCREQVIAFQDVCYAANIEVEADADRMIDLLVDPLWRAAFRRYAKKYDAKGEIHSFRELEEEYRRNCARRWQ